MLPAEEAPFKARRSFVGSVGMDPRSFAEVGSAMARIARAQIHLVENIFIDLFFGVCFELLCFVICVLCCQFSRPRCDPINRKESLVLYSDVLCTTHQILDDGSKDGVASELKRVLCTLSRLPFLFLSSSSSSSSSAEVSECFTSVFDESKSVT